MAIRFIRVQTHEPAVGGGSLEASRGSFHVGTEGDVLIAEGILKYDGCAINVKQGSYDDWVMRNARGYKERVLADPAERIPHHMDSLQNQ